MLSGSTHSFAGQQVVGQVRGQAVAGHDKAGEIFDASGAAARPHLAVRLGDAPSNSSMVGSPSHRPLT